MEQFIENMRKSILPENFRLEGSTVVFNTEDEFQGAVSESKDFLRFVSNEWGYECIDSYSDVFFSGFLGSYALSLWFMQFDEDNWFTFENVQKEAEKYLNSYMTVAKRRELRLIKGSFLPMNLDLPVVVDYEKKSITVWTGELND